MRINGQPIYRGDARPVNLYRGVNKIMGWRVQEQTGPDMTFERTYSGGVQLLAQGRSEQAETTQGKNICPTYFDEWETGHYNAFGIKEPYAQRLRIKRLIRVAPSTAYYFTTYSSGIYAFVVRTYGVSGSFISSVGFVNNGSAFSTGSTVYYLSISIMNGANEASMSYSAWQSEFGTGNVKPFICLNLEPDKAWSAFVPTSPSPDYPSPVISSAGGVRARDQAGARHADVAIPVLRAVPDGAGGWLARDSVETAGGRLIHRRRVDPAIDAHVTASIVGASQYVLASPVETDIGAALPSYYPCTRVLVSGDAPPEVTAACRVVDGA